MALTYFKRYRMDLDLRGRSFAAPSLSPGYRLLPWRDDSLEAHAEAKHRSFQYEIDAHVFPCFVDREGCGRLMLDIAGRPGFLPIATWLIEWDGAVDRAGWRNREPVGTVQGILEYDGVGAIQNLGVAPGHRGHGLGSLLLHHAVKGFQRSGAETVTLEVTAQNVGAVRLYQRFGFRKTRTVYKAVHVECV